MSNKVKSLTGKAKSELGELIVEQDDLLKLLASADPNLLKDYPHLKASLANSPQLKQYNAALRNGKFTRTEFMYQIFSMLDVQGYAILQQMNNLDFLEQKVISLVADDIEAISSLTIEQIGKETISQVLMLMSHFVYQMNKEKVQHPFLATKGRVDFSFWRHADQAYDAYSEGYNSHYKLDTWCRSNIDTRCPQSFPRWIREFGDPRLVQAWVDWKEALSNEQDAN